MAPAGLPPDATGEHEEYGLADEPMIRRARGWAVLRALGLISIGLAGERGLPGGKATWGPAGRAALQRVVLP